MSDLLLVGVGAMGRPYVRAAESLGVGIRVVETEDWAGDLPPGASVHRIAGMRSRSWRLDERWAEGAYAATAGHPIGGVLAFAEPHVLAAALVQDQLGLPGPSLHAAVLSRNKALQRACFAAHGLPQPEFTVVSDVEAAAGFAAGRLPVMLKSLASSGSAGVELVADLRRLRETVRVRAAAERLLVERAVMGPEYSWEGLVRRGGVLFGNLTAKETTGPPQFVEVSHRCAHQVGEDAARQVNALVHGVLTALGMDTGLVHLEFRLTAGGPVIMEVAVRTPGDFLLDLIAGSYGFDPYRAVVQLAMGLAVDLPVPPQARAFTAAMFFTCHPGRVVEVNGFDEIAQHPRVTRAGLSVRPGDQVHELRSSGQRVGHVLVEAPTAQERDQVLRTAGEVVRIVTV